MPHRTRPVGHYRLQAALSQKVLIFSSGMVYWRWPETTTAYGVLEDSDVSESSDAKASASLFYWILKFFLGQKSPLTLLVSEAKVVDDHW